MVIMTRNISPKERDFIRQLLELKILRKFSDKETKGVAKNGGVFVTCSDGDVDISRYHRKVVSDRPHEVKTFGGTLNVCPSFGAYDIEEEGVIVKNIIKGFKAKETNELFLGHHFACGMADGCRHDINIAFSMFYSAHNRFASDLGEDINKTLKEVTDGSLLLREETIFDFFYTKRLNKAQKIEQNAYVFDPDMYKAYFI